MNYDTQFIRNWFRFQMLFQVKLFLRDLENQIVQWVEFAIIFFLQMHLIIS
jgi:hypothetical protein